MDRGQFINEPFELGEATRRIAQTLSDRAISPRRADIADKAAELAQAEQDQSEPAD